MKISNILAVTGTTIGFTGLIVAFSYYFYQSLLQLSQLGSNFQDYGF